MMTAPSMRSITNRHDRATRDVLAALTLARLRGIVPARLARTMPTPGAVRMYLAVTAGVSIKAAARVAGCAPSYVRHVVRSVEERRDRADVDALIDTLAQQVHA